MIRLCEVFLYILKNIPEIFLLIFKKPVLLSENCVYSMCRQQSFQSPTRVMQKENKHFLYLD